LKKSILIDELLKWYEQNKRELPWRKGNDPYKIWLSEVILQQTRVDQGLPYFMNFVEKYPTVNSLALAHIDDVLRTWQGLGYYSRARNLHKCAKIIVGHYDGIFPKNKDELIKLPGIGSYTAAAIASLAYGKQEAVVDGNVIRVISRLYGIEADVSEQKTKNEIQQIVDRLIPKKAPDLFNQAIMEFGALHCSPKNPLCPNCIFMGLCVAQRNNQQGKIPYKSNKTKKRLRFFTYLIINIHGGYLMRKRDARDIWQGLFEFFLIETNSDMDFDQLSIPQKMIQTPGQWKISRESKLYKHLLSHQTLFCRFIEIEMTHDFDFNSLDWDGYTIYSKKEIDRLPKSILTDRYLGEKIN